MTNGKRVAVTLFMFMLMVCFFMSCADEGTAHTNNNSTTALPTVVEVESVSVEIKDEIRIINGDVMPWVTVPLVFKVGGRITKMTIDEGDSIEKDQFVAALDTTDYRLIRDLAGAQVSALDPHLDRARQLKRQDAVSQSQLDELLGKMSVAKIQKSQADVQLSYGRLRSPVAGVLIQKMASVGDMTDPKHPIGIVAELKRVKVILPVAQQDLALFEVGKEILLKAPGTTEAYEGKVHSIGYAADERTRTFPVTLEVPNEELLLRAGMIVEARIHVDSHRGIFLPLDAVSRNLAGSPVVMVADVQASKAVEKELVLGNVLGEKVQVLAGITPGEKVIVRGLVGPEDPIKIIVSQARNDASSKSAGGEGASDTGVRQ